MLVAILLIAILILVLAPDIVVHPPPPPLQETASRTGKTAVIAGERVFPMQLQQVTGGTAFVYRVWYYRGADGGADNDSCCYLIEPREETNHCGRREEMVSSFE